MKIICVNKTHVDPDRCVKVAFNKPPTTEQLAEIKRDVVNEKPLSLTIGYDYFPTNKNELNLDYLMEFPSLQALSLSYIAGLKSLEFLKELPNLEYLRIDQTKTTKLSLRPLLNLQQLRALKIEKHLTDLEVISELPNLEYLSLQSVSGKSFDFIGQAQKLRALRIALGSGVDLDFLKNTSLQYLEIWKVRGIQDNNLKSICEAKALEVLTLECLSEITCLPYLGMVRRLQLREMNQLQDLSFLSKASNLEELIVEGGIKLSPESFACLRNHSALKRINIGLGSKRKNDEVQGMLNLPSVLPISEYEFADTGR